MALAKDAKIIIVGAGVGGLTTAHALLHRKIVKPENIKVFERSPVLSPAVGGGFSLQSGAIILRKLGFREKLNEIAHPIFKVTQYGKGGKLLGKLDFYDAAKKAGTTFEDWMAGAMIRADLLKILSEPLPQGTLQLGKNVSGYSESKDKITLHLQNGENHECDLVIAADGIKSLLRKQSLGPQEPRFAKQAIWLGISNWKPTGKYAEAIPNTMVQIFGRGSYSGFYPCGPRGELIFWNVSPTETLLEESWEIAGAKNKFMEIVKEKDVPEPFPFIIDNATKLMHFGMYYRDPLPSTTRWHKGRLVILGDSAHATLPYLGQGANQAIEDAAYLAKSLGDSRFSTLEQALVGYHEARHKKVFELVKMASYMGKMELATSSIGTSLRDLGFSLLNKSGQFGGVFAKIWKKNAEDALSSMQ